jgi:predicted lysophospholipase L1 biosynthesis ABC-type transport system permease subunit
VVGVVADARAESMEDAAIPLIYISMYQNVEHRSPHHLAIFLRGNLDPAAITTQVRREVQAIDPGLPVFGEQKLGETVAAALAARRFAMEMVGLFALTALLLAAIGIYGVISFVVSERAHEIGVRLALGAEHRDIRRMVLRQGLGLAFAGAAVGLPCAFVASHLMAGLLFGVRPTDLPTFAGVAALLIGVAVAASYVPAWRAARIDPMALLRES